MTSTPEFISYGRERIRRGIDWTVRAHPAVAAGIASAAIIGTGAYVALDVGNHKPGVIASNPPAVHAAPAQPQAQDPLNERELARPQIPAPPSAPPETARAPRDAGPFAAPAKHGGSSGGDSSARGSGSDSSSNGSGGGSSSSSGGGSVGGSSGGGGGSGRGSGDGGSTPAPAQPPSSQPPPSQPSQPEPDCILKIGLLGNLVNVCL